MNTQTPDKDLQQLSAYLDGRLSEKERLQVEARLQSRPELQDELESLRRTQILLRQAPKRRAPRNFFITPEMAPRRPAMRLFPVFRLASALAGLLLVVAFAGDLLFGFAPQSSAPAAAPLAVQSESRSSNGASESNPLIFTWGTPAPDQVSGLGGGGHGGGPVSSDTLSPNLSLDNSSVPAPSPQGTPAVVLAVTPAAPPVETGTPSSLMSIAPLNSSPFPSEAVTSGPYQSGPVLGINPSEGGSELTQVAALNPAQNPPIELPRPALHILEGALALLAVLAGLAAFFFHRRENI